MNEITWYMKKILNATKDGVCQTITAHYHKEGWSNLIGGGSSKMLATAIIEYEEYQDTEQHEEGIPGVL